MNEAKKGSDFRSGHKKQTGLNMQAVCDANLQFVFASVKCPGKINDINAYRHSILSTWVEELPEDYFVSGDNANHLLSTFPGHDFGSHKDSFYSSVSCACKLKLLLLCLLVDGVSYGTLFLVLCGSSQCCYYI